MPLCHPKISRNVMEPLYWNHYMTAFSADSLKYCEVEVDAS